MEENASSKNRETASKVEIDALDGTLNPRGLRSLACLQAAPEETFQKFPSIGRPIRYRHLSLSLSFRDESINTFDLSYQFVNTSTDVRLIREKIRINCVEKFSPSSFLLLFFFF